MNTLEITRKILRENGLIAKKSYGQNFLIDDNALKNIVRCADITENDTVIEIGPGLGNLTHYILEAHAKVYAFEIDSDMKNVLDKRFSGNSDLKVITQDILKTSIIDYTNGSKIKIIANLPYYITTPIIFKLLDYREYIESITIMIQKEVAERLIANPHTKDYGVLTVNTNVIADIEKMFDVPNTSFIPAPKVTSTVIKITPNKEKEESFNIKDMNLFLELVKKSFSERRKKLANSLTNTGIRDLAKEDIEQIIKEVGLNENVRAEEVNIIEYASMSNLIYEKLQRK